MWCTSSLLVCMHDHSFIALLCSCMISCLIYRIKWPVHHVQDASIRMQGGHIFKGGIYLGYVCTHLRPKHSTSHADSFLYSYMIQGFTHSSQIGICLLFSNINTYFNHRLLYVACDWNEHFSSSLFTTCCMHGYICECWKFHLVWSHCNPICTGYYFVVSLVCWMNCTRKLHVIPWKTTSEHTLLR